MPQTHPPLDASLASAEAMDGPAPRRLTVQAVLQLAKLRLSALVVLSGVIAYMLGGDGQVDSWRIWLFAFAGLCTTISANIVNQILEIGPDSLMNRTRNRPLPQRHLEPATAWALVAAFGAVGMGLYLFVYTAASFWLALISWVLYGFVYTPLKLKSPISVAVGAIPGAMPLLIGYAAATGTVGAEALLLFVQQFIWQFPHFWAVAWVLNDDYARGGFRLLPGRGGRPDSTTALLMALYTLLLIPAGWLPYFLGYISLRAALVITLAGLGFLYLAAMLVLRRDTASAKSVMFGSFAYLPIAQLTILFDRLW